MPSTRVGRELGDTVDELAAHAPDHLFADFSDWRPAYDAIMG